MPATIEAVRVYATLGEFTALSATFMEFMKTRVLIQEGYPPGEQADAGL